MACLCRRRIRRHSSQTNGKHRAKRVDLAYNLAGQFTSIGRFNNVAGGGANEVATSTFTYGDAQGRLTSLAHRQGAALRADYAWAYDAFNRLTSFTSAVNPTENASYSYDSTGQLIGASYANGGLTNESYVYDTNGNRTNTAAASYTLGANNQILRDGTYEYQYDAEGNQTRRITLQGGAATGPTRTYAWDHRNRLIQVTETTSPNSNATTTKVTVYAYDGLNRRVSKVTAASVAGLATAAKSYYVYDDAAGNAILDLVDADGNGAGSAQISRRYLHGPAVDQVLAEEDVTAAIGAAGRVLWHLGDQLGSTRDLVDHLGALATHYKFDSFGAIKSGDTSKTRYIFTNQEYDVDTGNSLYNDRWYEPITARFLSEDPNPAGTFADGPNNYAYVHNGPTNATDPTGNVEIHSDWGWRVTLSDWSIDGLSSISMPLGAKSPPIAMRTDTAFQWRVNSDSFFRFNMGKRCKRCDEIAVVQIVREIDEWENVLFNVDTGWKIDSPDFIYRHADKSQTGKGPTHGNPTAINYISMEDQSYLLATGTRFSGKLLYFAQFFETYVVCIKGKEGIKWHAREHAGQWMNSIDEITVYAGVSWSHVWTRGQDANSLSWMNARRAWSQLAVPSDNLRQALYSWGTRTIGRL